MSGGRADLIKLIFSIMVFFAFTAWMIDSIYGEESLVYDYIGSGYVSYELPEPGIVGAAHMGFDLIEFPYKIYKLMALQDTRVPPLLNYIILLPLDMAFLFASMSLLVSFIPTMPGGG